MPKRMRPIQIDGDVAYVTLTKGYTAVVDAVDVPLISSGNWHAVEIDRNVYAMRNVIDKEGRRTGLLMHRVLLDAPKGMEVDHADCDGLNNRRSNIRLATHEENARNNRLQRNNRSGHKGVHWSKKMCKWVAAIQVNRKVKHLGFHDDIEEAKRAYALASAQYHGEFGRVA